MNNSTQLASSETIVEHFRLIKLFNDLSNEEVLAASTSFTENTYEKETIIFYERDYPEEQGQRIHFLVSGTVKLVKYASNGEHTIVRLCSVGEFFGVTSVLTDSPMPYTAETLTPCKVLSINKQSFLSLVSQYPHISLTMMTEMGKLLWFNYETHNQVVKKTDARVCKILLYHFNRDGAVKTEEGLQLKTLLPHDYIASATGIGYEESVRIVSRLKKTDQCLNYLRGGKIIITNLDKLTQIASKEQ
ncbi:MAG: Crp/Fnr family transcriptional regulator [Cyanobacteria bacterium P01_H01_bin.74]